MNTKWLRLVCLWGVVLGMAMPGRGAEEPSPAPAVAAHLAQVAQRHCRVPCPPRGERLIVVDGDLSDWGRLSEAGVAWQQEFDHTFGARRPGAADAAVARVMHDDQALYIAARVHDDSVLSHADAEDYSQGDVFEIYLDARPVRGDGKLLGDRQYSDGVVQILCSPPPANGTDLPWALAAQKVRPLGPIEAKGCRVADGYTLELRIPLASLVPDAPPERISQPIGIEFMVADMDEADGKRSSMLYYSWSRQGGYSSNASRFACTTPGFHPSLTTPWLAWRGVSVGPDRESFVADAIASRESSDTTAPFPLACRFESSRYDGP